MARTLDHIAVAVGDLDEALQRFVRDFGVDLEAVEDVAEAHTRTAFLSVGDPERPTRIELVTPLDSAGPLVRYLERNGSGLHHLCFRTDDLEDDMTRLAALGYRFTADQPTVGAGGTRVAWIHPRSTGGVLIELVEGTHGLRSSAS